MTDFYQEMQSVASGLLKEFKQGVIQYVKVVPGTGPGDNPGAPSETPYTLDAVARGVKFKFIDGTNIVRTDLQTTMAVRSDVTPDMKGFITVDGVRHKIIEVMPKPAAGTPVAHVIIFRK